MAKSSFDELSLVQKTKIVSLPLVSYKGVTRTETIVIQEENPVGMINNVTKTGSKELSPISSFPFKDEKFLLPTMIGVRQRECIHNIINPSSMVDLYPASS